jgi:putative tryptophan/tyrosine transport system substrate-binding protein
MRKSVLLWMIILAGLFHQSCQTRKEGVPSIAFLEAFEDETLSKARQGFFDALSENGYSEEEGSITVIRRNAQNDLATLQTSCDYIVSQKVDLIAASSTLATLAAAGKTNQIPVFMIVAPSPELSGLVDKNNQPRKNLSGVYETLDYLDTSAAMVKQIFPNARKIGVVYNQSEPQSVNALKRIAAVLERDKVEVISAPVNNSSETQMVCSSLISKGIDVFFALPDNVVFASFEVIARTCNQANIPVFTSESGLVARGALCAYGADMYYWGFQAGEMAARWLKNRGSIPEPQLVELRRKLYNNATASRYGLDLSNMGFTPLN